MMTSAIALTRTGNDQFRELAGRVETMLRQSLDDAARVTDFGVMEDGHAGLTYGCDVTDANGVVRGGYILKMAPAGVTRRGNTDVYRQYPLLQALKANGLLVPEVPMASAGEDLLGAPFIVMEKLPGRVFVVWEPHASFGRDREMLRSIWLQTATLLAGIHQIDWRAVLPGWEEPRLLLEEIDRWKGVLRHADDPAWLAAGQALDTALRASLPDAAPVGLVHGDYQPGNILFDDGRATGIIDWELASIGAQGLDVGWMLMMSDGRAWDAGWQPVAPVSGADIVGAYAEAGGPALANLAWHQALAQYRLGAIACLNVKLHRTGKRRDDLWERFAPSITTLFSHGRDLVDGTQQAV